MNILFLLSSALVLTLVLATPSTLPGEEPFLATPWGGPPGSPALYVFTYVSKINLHECAVFHGASAQGYHLNVLGIWEMLAFGVFQKFPDIPDNRLIPMFSALKKLEASDPTAVVLFLDASHTLLQLPPSALMQRFLATGLRTMFAAQATCAPSVMDVCGMWPPAYAIQDAVDKGVPTVWPNSGFYVGTVSALYSVWHGCYWDKVDKMHRGVPLPVYLTMSHKDVVGNDNPHLFFALMHCDGEEKPNLDYYQDFAATTHLRLPHYDLVPGPSLYSQRDGQGAASDTAPHSPLVRLQLMSGTHPVIARAPIAMHINDIDAASGTDTFIAVAGGILDGLVSQYPSAASVEAFLRFPVHMVGYRYGTMGDLCYRYPDQQGGGPPPWRFVAEHVRSKAGGGGDAEGAGAGKDEL